jgi:hypothetical protein
VTGRDPTSPPQQARRNPILLAALLLYGVALFLLRPLTPFEQDEVLFLRALEKYDVAKHAPHPPGYPLYIGMGKALRVVLGDPVLAVQLLSVLAAMAAVACVWLLAGRLGAPRGAATAGAAVLATVPTFLFHANVGFSDVPGTAVALAAAWLLVAALDRPGAFPVAGVAVAAAAAVRPQLVLAVLPLGLAALWVAMRRGRWGAVAGAVASGLGVSLACWLPAVLVTGPTRFRQAIVDATRWVADREVNWHLPHAPLGAVARQWLVFPWGTPVLAFAFWLLVLAGAVLWWRSGRRRLVAVAAGCAGFYILVALFTMNMAEGVRYILPALPFLAMLAGGVAEVRRDSLRRAVLGGVAVWCLAALVWLWPALNLRRSRPAPVWECLTWVASHADPDVTTVVFDGAFRPHVGYVLATRGFRLEEKRQEIAYSNFLPSGSVIFLTHDPRPSGQMLLRRSWDLPRLAPFSRHYYESCVVTREVAAGSVRFSGGFDVEHDWWELTDRGEVQLPEGSPMQIVRVAAGTTALLVRAGETPEARVVPGSDDFVPLLPGAAGTVRVAVFGGGTVRFPGLELFPVAPEDWTWLAGEAKSRELIVPAVAHAPGRMQTLWITDLLIRNPQAGAPLSVELAWSKALATGGTVVTRRRAVRPGETVLLRDVIAGEFHDAGRGALRLVGDRPFTALWRTYDEKLPHTMTDPRLLRAMTAAEAVGETTFELPFKAGTLGMRSNLGFFNPGGEPVELRIVLTEHGAAAPLDVQTFRLAPLAFELRDADKLLGVPRSRTITAEITVRFSASRPVLAFASIIENDSNRSTYVFAGETGAPPRP